MRAIFAAFLLAGSVTLISGPRAAAINITLDYTLDALNENWFGDPVAGDARRAAVDSAAAFLSAIIVNDDWAELASFNGSIGLSDIAASSIVDLAGQTLTGTAETDGLGYTYAMPVTNRSTVAANEYVVYVSAFEFDSRATAHAKAIWNGAERRNAAGAALAEFNTWGGYLFFDSGANWFTGLNPGVDPTDDYGVQDANKTPTADVSTDNWDWSTASDSWKGFQLNTLDPAASGQTDLYGTALHELLHTLGVSTSNLPKYVGVDGNGDFIGENLLDAYGGPVPGAGGHFAANVQSVVWGSNDIVSEALLDPSSTSGVRKYLTKVDAALLRDLGYQVLASFDPADFDRSGNVDGADLAVWQNEFSAAGNADANGDAVVDGADFLIWQRAFGAGASPSPASPLPEPPAGLLACLATTFAVLRTCQAKRRAS